MTLEEIGETFDSQESESDKSKKRQSEDSNTSRSKILKTYLG